jgi:O-antigen ligase
MIGILSYCVLMALLAIGTLRTPAVAFAAVLCLFGLKQWGQSTSMLIVEHRTATNIAIGCLVLLGLLMRVVRGQCVFCRLPPVTLFVILLYGYALVSLVWTPDKETSLEQWALAFPYLITVTVLGPLLIATTGDTRRVAYWTIFVGGSLLALAMVFGHWGSRGLIVEGDNYEVETNPLAIASLAGTVSVFAALSLQRGTPLLLKALLIAIVPLGFAVILRSGSRGQLLAAVIAVVVAWPIAYRQKNIGSFLAWVAGAATTVAGVWFASTLVDLNTKRWSVAGSNDDVTGRLDMGFALVGHAVSNPLTLLFGLGNSSAFHYVGYYPHVTVLEVLGEEGLLGLALFLAVIYLTLRSAVRLIRSPAVAGNAPRRAAVGILIGAFLFELILVNKQGGLLGCEYVTAYALVLGRLEVLMRRSPSPASSATRAAPSLPTRRIADLAGSTASSMRVTTIGEFH